MQALPAYTDLELFSLIAEGNEEAFRKLVTVYGPQIRPVVQELVRDIDYTKDLVQEVFLQLWLSREKLSSIENPRGWIFRIVYYQSYSWLRQRKLRSAATHESIIDQDIPSTEFSAEQLLTFQQTQVWLQQAIQELSPAARNIYLLSRNEGLKPAEIAERLNISVQTVKNTLHRAIQFIRKFLAEKGVWLPAALFLFNYF